MENEIIIDYDFLTSVLKEYYQSKYPNREIEIVFSFKNTFHELYCRNDGSGYYSNDIVCDVYLSYKTSVFNKETTIKDHIFLREWEINSILKEILNERLTQNGHELEISCMFFHKNDAQICLCSKETSKQKSKKI